MIDVDTSMRKRNLWTVILGQGQLKRLIDPNL